MKGVQAALVNYTGNRDNWGCQATSRSLLHFLRTEVLDTSGHSIFTVDYPPTHWYDEDIDALHGLQLKSIYASRKPGQDELLLLERLTKERFGTEFDRVRTADVVLFQGEGSIGPSYQFRSVRLFALPFLAKHLWRKPVFAMNQTLYANNAEDAIVLANVMNAFDMVAVREAISLQFARSAGIRNVVLCPDMAFRDAHMDGAVGLAVPQNLPSRFYCVSGSAAIKQYSLEAFVSLLREISNRFDIAPVLLASTKKDGDFSRRVADRLSDVGSRVITSSDYPDVRSIYPILSSAEFVIGGRYHTIVSALSVGTPVVILPANTYKCEGIGPLLGVDLPVHDLGKPWQILDDVEVIMRDRKAAGTELRLEIKRLEKSFNDFAACLKLRIDGEDDARCPDPPDFTEIHIAPENQRIYSAHNEAEVASVPELARMQRQAKLFFARKLGILRRSISRSANADS